MRVVAAPGDTYEKISRGGLIDTVSIFVRSFNFFFVWLKSTHYLLSFLMVRLLRTFSIVTMEPFVQ